MSLRFMAVQIVLFSFFPDRIIFILLDSNCIQGSSTSVLTVQPDMTTRGSQSHNVLLAKRNNSDGLSCLYSMLSILLSGVLGVPCS